MTNPADQKGKAAATPLAGGTAEAESSERKARRAEQAVADTEAAIRSAKIDLQKARFEEQEYWEQKRPGSTEQAQAPKIEATWHFWKGDDWTAEEKRELRKIHTALVIGIGGLSPVIAGAFTLDSARAGLDAANARVQAEDTATNRGLAESAVGSLKAAVTNVVSTSYGYLAVIAAATLAYYDLCAKHAEKVKELNAPDVAKRRESLEKWLADLERKLDAERLALHQALPAPQPRNDEDEKKSQ